jgi:ABC-2 type transport system permease protein
MIKLWSIARTAFLQTIRQPIYMVLVLVTFALLVTTLPFAGWTLSVDFHKSDQQMMEDLGLGTLRIAGLLIAAFSASSVLRREIEEKTALIVIAKPVSRAVFVLGKFVGVTAAVAVAYYLCSLVFLMTVRHRVMPAAYDKPDWPVIVIALSAFGLAVLVTMLGNLWFGWPFTSTGVWSAALFLTGGMVAIGFVGKQWQLIRFGAGISPQLVLELVTMFLAVVILVALAVAASSRLGQAMTLLVCSAVFVAGSAHPLILGRWADEVLAARVLGWIVPNFTWFYPQDDLTVAEAVPLSLVARAALYCVLYSAGVLAVGVGLFQTRELEAETSSASMPARVGLLAWAGRAAAIAAALVAGVLLSLPKYYTLAGFGSAGGLLAAAVGGWILWGGFGRGRQWSYYLVLAACVLTVPTAAALLLLGPRLLATRAVGGPVLLMSLISIAAAILVVLLLPKTRRHFEFGRR